MKLETTQHPKFRELKELLGLRDYAVAGVLELLWHVAARYHDDGGIGRWKDGQLARAVDYDGDPRHLVRCLVSAGWLDEVQNTQVRLAVHDWLMHCPNHVWDRVRKRAKRLVGKSPETLTAEQAWLVSSYERARVERNRDGADDEGGRDDPPPSGNGQERPAASGNVRPHPATAPPNPRPTTHDPRPEEAADAALGEAASTPTGDMLGRNASAAAAWTDWEPLNIPTSDPDVDYVVGLEEWAMLKKTYPELSSLAGELRGLIGHLRANREKRVAPDRVQDAIAKWLRRSVAQPALRAQPNAPARTSNGHTLKSTVSAARFAKHAALDQTLDESLKGEAIGSGHRESVR